MGVSYDCRHGPPGKETLKKTKRAPWRSDKSGCVCINCIGCVEKAAIHPDREAGDYRWAHYNNPCWPLAKQVPQRSDALSQVLQKNRRIIASPERMVNKDGLPTEFTSDVITAAAEGRPGNKHKIAHVLPVLDPILRGRHVRRRSYENHFVPRLAYRANREQLLP